MTVTIAPLAESHLPAAERIFRLAFGTFTGLPDPLTFSGDCAYTATRWRADPEGALAALRDGELVGSNFAVRWGRFGLFGPLSVRPDLWQQGIARQLLDATLARFDAWGITASGLFTFAESPKHIGLYLSYGYYPRFLTAIMAKASGASGGAAARRDGLSGLGAAERAAAIAAAAVLTGAVHPGLDLAVELESIQAQGLGDTLLLRDGDGLAGLAACHVGAGSEAGGGVCYVKFGAVLPGPGAAGRFARLLDLVEAFAAARGAAQIVVGVNTAREPAYRALLARGFRTFLQGVAMHRDNQPVFSHPDAWVLDDWR